MSGFKEFIIATLLIGVCIFAMLGFVVTFQVNNHANGTIMDNPTINRTYSNLYTNLASSQGTAESQRTGFEKEVPTVGTDSFLFSSIIGAVKTFTSTIANVFSIIFVYLGSVLGISPVVIGVFVAIIIISVILLAWRVAKVGE